jgi:hypothetical protein
MWGRILGRVGVSVAVVALVALLIAGCGSPAPITTTTSAPTSSTTTQPTVPAGLAPYEGLWPFRSAAEVVTWEQTYRSTGSDAWHLQAGTTALDFTTNYLGFADIDSVISTVTNSTGMHVTVGFHPTSSQSSPSAVIHMVRWGSGAIAPWEVVGTDDTTFAMTTPAYGSVVSTPLRVGGTITGVDENIRVTVRQPSSTSPLGTFCCMPAGGTASPWSASVSYTGATDPVLTVIAVTGGHVQASERFTVTAVLTG